jgi:hypothetical protein
MKYSCDIFKIGEDGTLHRVEAAMNLEIAKVRVRALAEAFPGEYVVLDLTTGQKLSIKSEPALE